MLPGREDRPVLRRRQHLGLHPADRPGATERARDLAARYAAVAAERGCPFVDAGAHISSSDTDGIHLDASAHETLGVVLARQVRELLA
jgi:hypothetical protein